MPRKLTQQEFIEKATLIHGNKYDYSNVKYITGHIKIDIICNKHGTFSMSPVCHLSQQQGCIKCANEYKQQSMRLSTEEFIERAISIHGNKYDYSKSNYIDSSQLIQIICDIHGDFLQTPNNHLHGKSGCPLCGDIVGANKRKTSKSKFIILANKVHGIVYNYELLPERFRMKDKIIIKCPIHGEYNRLAEEHIYYYKIGCPLCGRSESIGEQLLTTILTGRNIIFKKQQTFENCRGRKKLLMYDFFLPLYNIVIEYDGPQHYRYIPWIHKTIEAFNLQVEYDTIKNEYCSSNNIKMIRIRTKNKQDILNILDNSLICP